VSRSRRKSPVCGFTTASSEKKFKKECNSAFRAKERRIVQKIKEELESDLDIRLPKRLRDVVEPWAGDKDGKHYFGYLKKKNPKEYNKLMRK
jgi:hypothetical protein